jgi:FkbM family methyltransferase
MQSGEITIPVREALFGPIERLWGRPDFQRNPVHALGRRALWRARWAYSNEPWRLSLANGGTILVPKGGAGALIYYLGYSEPDTARFLMSFLRAGMVFWDVGAHIGEFSLLASRQVGAKGRVDAFEPNPQLSRLICRTIEANRLPNVTVHSHAVADRSGVAEFVIDSEPSISHMRAPKEETPATSTIAVSTLPLDDFHLQCGYSPHLVKIDVEGAEMMVLQGAQSLLRLPPETAPVWITEFAPENCARYHYHPDELLNEFSREGYKNFWLTSSDLADAQWGKPPDSDCLNFVSTKNDAQLKALLDLPPDNHVALDP